MKRIILALTISIIVASCSTETPIRNVPEKGPDAEAIEAIPVETALATLQAFMSEAYPETRASVAERIAGIEIHYSNETLTKAGEPMSDAYIVNFSGDSGYAVLGANTSVDRIVAVTEHGNLKASDIDEALSDVPREDELFYDEDGNLITEFYCEEDDDYYCANFSEERPLRNFEALLVAEGLDPDTKSSTTIDVSHPEGCYTTPGYMVKTCWRQGSYNEKKGVNKYCTKRNKTWHAGCSTVALAQIMGALKFPSMTINKVHLDWDEMTNRMYATDLDSVYYNQVALLYGLIFHKVNKILAKNGTLITPLQIKKFMEEVGFDNVVKHNAERFTNKMLEKTLKMLLNDRPVFMSAIPKDWSAGHSWVIDGAQYSDGSYLLHFNFGWSGDSNGYFSTSCLNPTKAVVYDDISRDNQDPDFDYEYSWHFRMITYDSPDYSTVATLNF